MRIAVTGANGRIARRFINTYQDQYDILALTRKAKELAISGADVLETDYSVERLSRDLAGADGIAHLAYAMATKENEAGGLSSYRSSMEMTAHLFEAASLLGIRNIVFTSSRLVYPGHTETAFRETDETGPTNHYGESKVLMEQLAESYRTRDLLAVKVLRLGQVIGDDRGKKSLFGVFLTNAEQGKPLRLIGNNIRDYIYEPDVCLAIKRALEHPENAGIYNISMGVPIDNTLMAEEICRTLRSGSRVERDLSVDGQGDRFVLDCTRAGTELGFRCRFDSISRIVQDIYGLA